VRNPCEPRIVFTRATETAILPRLAVRQSSHRDAFHRVAIGQVIRLAYEQRLLPVVRECCATRAPFSPRNRRRVCQHVVRSVPWPASQRRFALRLPIVATRDASDRLLPSHYFVSVPVPRQLPPRPTLSRLRDRRDCLLHGRATRFGGSHDPLLCHRGGRCFPAAMRANRTSDTPVASPSWSATLARARNLQGAAEVALRPLA